MLAALSDDQRQLVDMAAQLAEELGVPVPASLPSADDCGHAWTTLAATGLLGMHLPERLGGGGAHSADVALVVEQLGRRTSLAPYLGQGVLAPELARLAGAPVELLAKMLDGTLRATVALTADLSRLGHVGEEIVAWDSRGATHALVLAAGNRLDLVELDTEPLPQADLTRVVRKVGSSASREPAGDVLAPDRLTRLHAFTLALVGADLVGVMQGALDAAVLHVSTRVQFGVPVGSFQAVQHLAADAKVLLEGSRSALWYAAWAADELSPDDALLAARQLKAYASAAALDVVEVQTQLFGGIALTWEEMAHVRTRRVLSDRLLFGDEHAQLAAIAESRLGVRL